MKQVDFYLLSNQVIDGKYKFASRLANKLQRLDQSTLIVTDDTASSELLDEVMWSFSDTSFVAHDRIGSNADGVRDGSSDSVTSKQRPGNSIHIAELQQITDDIAQGNYDVLINLASEVPLFNHHFGRIAEIVEADDTAKAAARLRFKSYQDEGFALKTHPIEL